MFRCYPFLILPLLLCVILMSCSTGAHVSKPGEATALLSIPPSLEEKQKSGIDFFAKGALPSSWTAEISFGKIIRFTSLDGANLASSAVEPTFDDVEKITRFRSVATGRNIEIILYNEACLDALSGITYNKKVKVIANGKTYEGCGQYLFNKEIAGTWILEKTNNEIVLASQFSKGAPQLSFDLSTAKLSGHDGCNTVAGDFELLGNKIRFSSLASTKMLCANKNGFQLLPRLSEQTVDYFFTDGKLYLYLADDSMIIFSRKK